jgi:hypothetical protein
MEKQKRTINQLRNQLASKCRSLAACRRDLEKWKTRADERQKRLSIPSQLTHEQQQFFEDQCKAASLPKKGMRWSAAAKRSAVTLYLKSPAAYRCQSRKWRLPHKTTLLKSVRAIFRKVSQNYQISITITQ